VSPASTLESVLAPLREHPKRTALLFDIDGVLAPIVRDAGDAAVPPRSQRSLLALAGVYGLVACVTGRQASDARRVVGLGMLAYVGSHGVERLPAGSTRPVLDPAVGEWAGRVQALGRELDTPEVRTLGIRREDKGPVVAFHWRGARDEAAAAAAIDELAVQVEAAGLHVHRGRKVMEVRPPVPMEKGRGVRALLADVDVDRALYAGDDVTDLDAFRALTELRDEGELEAVVRIAVRSDEGPSELVEQADSVVEEGDGVPDLLDALLPG
jgi:trehalose 6-phosphate phosphatase